MHQSIKLLIEVAQASRVDRDLETRVPVLGVLWQCLHEVAAITETLSWSFSSNWATHSPFSLWDSELQPFMTVKILTCSVARAKHGGSTVTWPVRTACCRHGNKTEALQATTRLHCTRYKYWIPALNMVQYRPTSSREYPLICGQKVCGGCPFCCQNATASARTWNLRLSVSQLECTIK
mgnify:CR=1 FL=1